MIEGTVELGGPDHVLVPFEVPSGVRELELRFDDLSAANVLDWGVEDPQGHRGWSGGNLEPAILNESAATRSHVPGPIHAGTWNLVIGKAKLVELPAPFRLEVELRSEPSLAPQPERTPYAPRPALANGPAWFAGDFHVHSRESGDAAPTIAEVVDFARGRGLSFIELSEHNVVTQLDFLGAAAEAAPELLVLPGIEVTTYAGHLNAIGATAWVEHRIGLDGHTVTAVVDQIHRQGALVAINHPTLALGTACIGCAWAHSLDGGRIDAVEIATGGLSQTNGLFSESAIAFWDELCAAGHHVAAIGGSDDHRGGVAGGLFHSPIGDATTLVYADELSAAGILEGIRRGRTVVKLQGIADPTIELWPIERARLEGDTVAGARVGYRATVHDGAPGELRVIVDGQQVEAVAVAPGLFEHDFEVDSPEKGERRVRIELWIEGKRRVITSHIWQRLATEPGDSTDDAGAQAPEAAGCGCRPPTPGPGAPLPIGVGLLMLLGPRARRRPPRLARA